MDEYISREEVVKEIKSRICAADDAWESGYNTAMAEIMEWIKHIPSADVQPVKHGRWIKHRIDDPKSILYGAVKDTTCSICGNSTPYNTECCMHCGARMDGDNNE